MKVLVQNLQEVKVLGTESFKECNPDQMILQKINFSYKTHRFPANNVSWMGYGVAIGSNHIVTNAKLFQSPYSNLEE